MYSYQYSLQQFQILVNAPMPASITVTKMLHVPTQREVTNVCVMMDIQETGRFVKVRNRPHVPQNIFQQSTHRRVFNRPIHKRKEIYCIPNVCLSFLPSRYFITVLLFGNHLTYEQPTLHKSWIWTMDFLG